MSSQNSTQGFPQTQMPFVDERGGLTLIWRRFLTTLWQRTGASQGSAAFVSGFIMAFGGSVIPDGWIACDGSAISRAGYPQLFSVLGTSWGPGDGVSTFNIPDLRGRMLIGTNGTYPLAATGGAAQVTIATANLPAHNHPIVDPGHTHATATTASNATAGADPVGATAGNTGSSTTGITTGNTGSGNALTTISPYASIQYIIKL